MAELHLIGQIIGGKEFSEKSICCRWQLSSGKCQLNCALSKFTF
jgi:hypothetical protein